MDTEIIAIGTELLLGATVDTNSAWLARELGPLGVVVRRVSIVDDDEQVIAGAVAAALQRAELVICSGGLGPTADDVTREGVARALGRELEFRPELLEQIEARFRSIGRVMSESNRRQAYIPAGAQPISNPHGTAPSFLIEEQGRAIIAFPGVPSELRYLAQHALVPYLRDQRGLRSHLLVRSVRLSGLTESAAGELIADLMGRENPRVGITAKGGQYEIRIAAAGASQEEAEALMEPVEASIRERTAAYLLQGDGLADHVLQLLERQEHTLALYEGQREAPIYRDLGRARPSTALRVAVVDLSEKPAHGDAALEMARSGAEELRHLWQTDLALGLQVFTADDGAFAEACYVLLAPWGEETLRRRIDLALQDGWAIAGSVGIELLRRALEQHADETGQSGG